MFVCLTVCVLLCLCAASWTRSWSFCSCPAWSQWSCCGRCTRTLLATIRWMTRSDFHSRLCIQFLYWALILLGLALCLPSASVFGLNGAVYKKLFFAYILLFIFQWAAPGGIGAWHGCTVSEMTYSVSSGTLNFTIPFHLTVHSCCWFQLKYSPSNWLLLLSCIAIQMR